MSGNNDYLLDVMEMLANMSTDNDVIGTGVIMYLVSETTIKTTVFPIYGGRFFTVVAKLAHVCDDEENPVHLVTFPAAEPVTVFEQLQKRDSDYEHDVKGVILSADALEGFIETVQKIVDDIKNLKDTNQ